MAARQNELQFEYEGRSYVFVLHDREDSSATCHFCGKPVEGLQFYCTSDNPPLFHLHVDCIDQRMNFLQSDKASDFGRNMLKSNDPNVIGVLRFVQSFFKEVTEKMCSRTWTPEEAMPEVVVFAHGGNDYKATLVVLEVLNDDTSRGCLDCNVPLRIGSSVYISDIHCRFHFHPICALRTSLSVWSHSRSPSPSSSHSPPPLFIETAAPGAISWSPALRNAHAFAIPMRVAMPFDGPSPSPPPNEESNQSSSPLHKFLVSFYNMISRRKP